MIAFRERLKVKEGTVTRKGRHVPYRDSVGKLTIGWGRNLDDRGLSDAEAEFLLANDIADHTLEARGAFPWVDKLDPIRQEVLFEMAFNMGIPVLSQFRRTLAAMERNDAIAADYMLQSKWARQVGQRAEELAYMWRNSQRIPT